MQTLFSAQDIRNAVNAGKTVYWKWTRYKVIKDKMGQWFIQDNYNGTCIGLTWTDGITLNGEVEDFLLRGNYEILAFSYGLRYNSRIG